MFRGIRTGMVAAGAGLVLLALTSQTLVAAPTAAGDPPAKRFRVLALGDSFSSGEGVFDAENACAQSSLAYPRVAARSPAWEQYLREPRVVDFYACTGARTFESGESADLVDQLTVVRNTGKRYGLVTMTIGGNDLGFSDVLYDCVRNRFRDFPPPGKGCSVTEAELNARVDRLGARLPEIYDRVADTTLEDGGHLAVLGYPRLFEDPDKWTGVEGLMGSCMFLDRSDAAMFRRVADRLNLTIRNAVVQAINPGVEFVGVAAGFEGHNLCAGEEWLNGVSKGLGRKPASGDRVIPFRDEVIAHPNHLGHAYMADVLTRAVPNFDWSEYGRKQSPPNSPRPPSTPQPTGTPQPPSRDPGGPNEICREASHERVCVHTDILTGSDDAAGLGHGPYAAPRRMYVGSNLVIQGIEWQDWGEATARGRGWTMSTDCDPNCAEGNAVRQGVEVEVSELVDTRDLRVYTCARARKDGEDWGSLGPGLDRVCLDVEGRPVDGG